MNILFLAPRFPLPADTGGKIRTLNILKQIAKENKVHLACFSFENEDAGLVPELERLGIKVSLVKMRDPFILAKVYKVLFSPVPYSIGKYNTPEMRKVIQKIVSEGTINAVHVDHLHMAHYEDCFGTIPYFLDEHNVEYKILERCALVDKSFIKKFIYISQTYKMRVIEARKTKGFDGIFACSLDDQLMLSKLTVGLVPTHVIPNGVDTEFFDSLLAGEVPEKENALVFTGSMDWLPNDDAITYFCDQILPLVWQKNDKVKLYVVGKSPSASVKALADKDSRVIVTGRVDDVRPYIMRSKIFIVPLRIGGGTRLKILEAMAMRKAVVSTTIGAEGIAHKNGVDIALADTPEDFAKTILGLLDNPTQIASMEEEGRKLVCQKYDWNIVGTKLNSVYKEALRASE